jgi:lipopolysaccharide biosynthesis glycosyltransferase
LNIKGLDGDWVRGMGRMLTSKIPHVSATTYGKLLIPRLLSQSFNRCLILDSDLLVRGDLDPLFVMDLEGKAIGAAKDGVDASKSASRLGLGDDDVYFNSGVLLIDLHKWKLEKPLLRLPDLIEENHASLIFMEQDILNLLFHGRFKQLDPKWNAMMVIVPRGYLRNWEGIPEDQAILHFAGELKPWHEFYQPLMRNLYLGYDQLCPWIKLPKLGPSGAIQKKAALILAKEFGLKNLISKYS